MKFLKLLVKWQLLEKLPNMAPPDIYSFSLAWCVDCLSLHFTGIWWKNQPMTNTDEHAIDFLLFPKGKIHKGSSFVYSSLLALCELTRLARGRRAHYCLTNLFWFLGLETRTMATVEVEIMTNHFSSLFWYRGAFRYRNIERWDTIFLFHSWEDCSTRNLWLNCSALQVFSSNMEIWDSAQQHTFCLNIPIWPLYYFEI